MLIGREGDVLLLKLGARYPARASHGGGMKRILDADFRYTPSFETDIRRTFERIRRERSAPNGFHNNGGRVLGAGGGVDAQRARRRLERGELAVEERGGHVAVLAFCKA